MASQGELSLQQSTIATKEMLESVYQRTLIKAQARKVSLLLELPSTLPEIRADKEKISWVILQLLDNAVKFSPENGRVILSSNRDGDYVNITVSDNGIGISPERIPELFEPFHQLDGSSTRRYGGTGIGLALAKQIINAHGSSIKVFSKINQGTRMEILLPANEK